MGRKIFLKNCLPSDSLGFGTMQNLSYCLIVGQHRRSLPVVSKYLSISSLECALITGACIPVLAGPWGAIGGEVASQIVISRVFKCHHLTVVQRRKIKLTLRSTWYMKTRKIKYFWSLDFLSVFTHFMHMFSAFLPLSSAKFSQMKL